MVAKLCGLPSYWSLRSVLSGCQGEAEFTRGHFERSIRLIATIRANCGLRNFGMESGAPGWTQASCIDEMDHADMGSLSRHKSHSSTMPVDAALPGPNEHA